MIPNSRFDRNGSQKEGAEVFQNGMGMNRVSGNTVEGDRCIDRVGLRIGSETLHWLKNYFICTMYGLIFVF